MQVSEIKDELASYRALRLLDPSLHVVTSYPSKGVDEPNNISPAIIARIANNAKRELTLNSEKWKSSQRSPIQILLPTTTTLFTSILNMFTSLQRVPKTLELKCNYVKTILYKNAKDSR